MNINADDMSTRKARTPSKRGRTPQLQKSFAFGSAEQYDEVFAELLTAAGELLTAALSCPIGMQPVRRYALEFYLFTVLVHPQGHLNSSWQILQEIAIYFAK